MKILFCTDFSEASNHAIEYTLEMTERWASTGASAVLVHAFKPLVPYTNTPSMPVMKNDDLQLALEKKLEQQTKLLEKKVSVTSYFENGSPLEAIKNIIGKESPDLIVMGTREKDLLERMTIGTNTLEVALGVDTPVFAIPKETSFTSTQEVVFATDLEFTDKELENLEFLKKWLVLNQCKLKVLHIAETAEEELKQQMKSSKLNSLIADIDHSYHPLVHKDFYKALKTFVANDAPDLVVLFPKSRNFLQEIFHHSDMEKMTYHLQIPMLLLG